MNSDRSLETESAEGLKNLIFSEKVKKNILAAAITAPSGDNSQPWQFRWTGENLFILLDLSKLKALLSEDLSGAFLSLGAVIENIKIAASVYSLDISWEFQTENPGAPGAVVRFLPLARPASSAVVLAPLFARQTNRHPFKKAPLPAGILQALKSCADPFQKKVRLRLVSAPGLRKQTALLCQKSEAMGFANQRMHREFHAKIIYGKAAQSAPSGLAVHTLGLSFLEVAAMRLFRPWSRMNFFIRRFGLHHLMAFKITRFVADGPALGAILIEGNEAGTLIEAGRLMQGLWITAAKLGLGFQPSMTFQYLRTHAASGSPDLSASARRAVADCDRQFQKLWGLQEDERLAFFFRVGFPTKITPKSLRRPMEEFLEEESRNFVPGGSSDAGERPAARFSVFRFIFEKMTGPLKKRAAFYQSVMTTEF